MFTFSCKKHNDEDPWFAHRGKHLNECLEGEWELVALHVNEQVYSTFSANDYFEDCSNLLEIDTMNIAKFFKFVPTKEIGDLEGKGNVYIRTKSMPSYPDKLGISLNLQQNMNDTNVGLGNFTYHFREGSNNPFFKFGVENIDTVDVLDASVITFKPLDEYFVFNNFFYRNFYDFEIKKATKNELILYNSVTKESGVNALYRRYRFTFKKIN